MEELDLKELINMFWTRKLQIVIIVAIFLIIGAVAFLYKPTYSVYINGEKGYPNLYEQEIGGKIDSGKEGLTDGIDKESVNKSGLNRSDVGTADGFSVANTSLTVTQTSTHLEINEENFGEAYQVLEFYYPGYWVASRSVNCLEDHIEFAIFGVDQHGLNEDGGWGLWSNENSGVYGTTSFAYLRAVVVLSPQVEITVSDDATNPDTPHIITKY